VYNYNDIEVVHLEMTEACNASCPMCARNLNGGDINPHLNSRELSISDVERIFPVDFVRQLKRIYMCGNYGDPAVARDTLEAFAYFREHNPDLFLSMHTNGSMKKPEWWAELAQVIGRKGYVVFGLDGLEDTNHLYRQGTVWSKIMDNVKAFIAAGGRARWDFIVFAHNEHQVEAAEELSKQMGFEKFQFKKSARFFSNTKAQTKDVHQAQNRKGLTTLLQAPTNPKYRNAVLDQLKAAANPANAQAVTVDNVVTVDKLVDLQGLQNFSSDPAKKKPVEHIWDEAVIDCKVAKEKNLYITAEGVVQPCCWLAGQMYVWYYKEKGAQVWRFIDEVGLDNLNAKNHSLEQIVNGDYFQRVIPDSWNKPSCAEGKAAMCAKICGTKYDAFSEQFK
jgi:MoaA/NifB/PqqE/SkfB family radical SAM enzyme